MTSRLAQMQARFQQKQIQEKEEKLLRLYESQQQRAFERVGHGSAGSAASLASTGGKVRQMFDERRRGVDRACPLEPLPRARAGRTPPLRAAAAPPPPARGRSVRADEADGHADMVRLMNEHNMGASYALDDEVMPQIGFGEGEEAAFLRGKLANVGGRLPSEAAKVGDRGARANGGSTIGKTFRKEAKPIVKRTVKPAVSSPTTSLSKSPSPSQTMFKQAPARAAPAAGVKSPSNARPSAKQTPKAPVARDDLAECRYCNRRFASDRLQVHEGICAKTTKKKRKTYDATKHRVEGTELQAFVGKKPQKNAKATNKPQAAGKKDWRKTHEEFINAIRSAKQAQAHLAKGGKLCDLPPPTPSSNPDYIQCPHCGRKFNEAAAERHIPKCATYSYNKPSKPPAKGGKR